MLGTLPTAAAAATEPADAEFAIRWNTREGGPATVDAALAVLALRARHESRFKVGYFNPPATSSAPAGFTAILRRREEGDRRAELTFKLRGDRVLEQWSCPLRNAGPPKAEVDVTFGKAGALSRAFSYSCTREDPASATAEFSATRKACVADVMRRQGARVRVEEWQLPGGATMIEVSGRGENSAKALESFRARVVVPLLAAGIRPVADSKTELGSRCP
ncbi:MAG TPA: hypothetical protein PLW68_01555 [Casimicrobiaceae bacterium]|nr:hypothetical protein [Casimicrobiaceae bacterium]